MFTFSTDRYGHEFSRLLAQEPLCELGPGKANHQMQQQLSSLTLDRAFQDKEVTDLQMANCCLSAVWMLFDFLHASHEISQQIPSSEGSYWHGIMHRREGDFSNAKYWFRRAGNHPIFAELAAGAKTIADSENAHRECAYLNRLSAWDPFQFVDVCQLNVRGGENQMLCRRIAQLEWRLLFDHCYQNA